MPNESTHDSWRGVLSNADKRAGGGAEGRTHLHGSSRLNAADRRDLGSRREGGRRRERDGKHLIQICEARVRHSRVRQRGECGRVPVRSGLHGS